MSDDLRDGLARALYEDDIAHERQSAEWDDMGDGEDVWYRDNAAAALAYLASRADEAGIAEVRTVTAEEVEAARLAARGEWDRRVVAGVAASPGDHANAIADAVLAALGITVGGGA